MNIREFFAGIFGESEKRESSETETMQSSETMITAAFLEGLLRERLSGRDALKIPAFAAAVELISTIIAGINFKLYRYEDNKIKECEDRRERLFNAETGDLLNGFEMKKAMVRDYMISGNAYIYINMGIDGVESLHYVDEKDVSVIKNSDPIFKRAALLVGGGRYFTHECIIVTRNSVDGVEGVGVLEESDLPFGLAMNILKLLNKDSTNGGLKKGYLTSDVYLDDDNLAKLKEGYAKFQKNPDGILVLNEGIKFQDASSTVVELEIKDIYKKIGDEVGELAGVPAMIRNGTAGNDQYRNWFRSCVIP
ncbi:MAG: phage portal protein, partial [Firmicutes bacterium]|nr:phage portal protein [Bacillota bacterium]